MKTCPACAENISPRDAVCPFCGVRVYEYVPAGGRGGPSKKMPTSVLVLIIMACLFGVLMCSGIPIALLLPAVQQAREAARRTQCKNNLKQIGLALHNYHDTYNTFPPAYIADENGKPMHSWRVLILPYLDQQPLYEQYDFSEPWNGPNNSRILNTRVPVYACPSHPGTDPTLTAYAGIFGENCIFRGAESVPIREITDGTSNTILVSEADRAAIPWTKPEDINIDKLGAAVLGPNGLSSHHAGGFHVLMADGAVRFVSENISLQALSALFTYSGGEVVGEF
jgi:hypothetical protein